MVASNTRRERFRWRSIAQKHYEPISVHVETTTTVDSGEMCNYIWREAQIRGSIGGYKVVASNTRIERFRWRNMSNIWKGTQTRGEYLKKEGTRT